MQMYGVCISDINKINNKKAHQLLVEQAKKGHGSFLNDFEANRRDNGDDYTVSDYLYDYEADNGYCGLSAFLRDVIREAEGIDVDCDDPNGVHYLGLPADAPWAFNKRTRNMTAEGFRHLLSTYINKITDETLEIRWWYVEEWEF